MTREDCQRHFPILSRPPALALQRAGLLRWHRSLLLSGLAGTIAPQGFLAGVRRLKGQSLPRVLCGAVTLLYVPILVLTLLLPI